MLMKLTMCQFHQHFAQNFFDNILAPKNCKAKHTKRKTAQFDFLQKTSE
jgi:hypothetical protein